MGRVKLQIRKIENTTSRQVTFSKRRNGLIKKAYELSVLCDIELALIMFSPSDRLSLFSSQKRIEDVLSRYVNLTDHDRGCILHNREYLISTIQKIKDEEAMILELGSSPEELNLTSEELLQEISSLQQQLQEAEEQLSAYEPDVQGFTTMEELESSEKNLLAAMDRVTQRQKELMDEHLSAFEASPTTQMNSLGKIYFESPKGVPQTSLFQSGFVNWLPENRVTVENQNPIFGDSGHPFISLRTNSPAATAFNQLCDPGDVKEEPSNPSGQQHDQIHDSLKLWHNSCTSNVLLDSLMPSTYFPQNDHMVEGRSSCLENIHGTCNCPETLGEPTEHMEEALSSGKALRFGEGCLMSCREMPSKEEDGEIENKTPDMNDMENDSS